MHYALEIQEILLSIFGHCRQPRPGNFASDLPALARTCRAFKEPALDVLWEVLYEASPLARCLPEAVLSPTEQCQIFNRPLTQEGWDTLQSYTRRIRSVDFTVWRGPDWKSLTIISNPTEPLFPNLRYLDCDDRSITIPLLHLPLPSLISLRFLLHYADNLPGCQDFLNSFLELAPNIRRLGLNQLLRPSSVFSDFASSYIRRWRNLEEVLYPEIPLNMDILMHLSRMPALTRLEFMTSTTSGPCDSPLIFSGLHHMRLHSLSFPSISSLLSRIRLPTIIGFIALVASSPSKKDFSSFLTNLQTSNAGHSMESLVLYNSELLTLGINQILDQGDVLLDLEDLRPCMAFTNLRYIDIDLRCKSVGLTDSGLLELATAWPRLEDLKINSRWGWYKSGGITPNGLLQLLQTCRSLSQIALAIDTRGYTESPPSSASLGATFPRALSIDVLDSIIEAESVPAIAAFFTGIALSSELSLFWGHAAGMPEREDCLVYAVRWDDVHRIVKDACP